MALYKKLISKILNKRKSSFNSIEQLPCNPNIIINATFNIGDYMSISPIIESIKEKWNYCEVTILCTKSNIDIVKYDPRVNYICLPDRKKWLKYPRFIKKSVKKHTDLLIEPATLDIPYRSIIGYTLKPSLTIGIDYEGYACIQKPKHKIKREDVSQPELYANMMISYGFSPPSDSISFKIFESKSHSLKIKEKLKTKALKII